MEVEHTPMSDKVKGLIEKEAENIVNEHYQNKLGKEIEKEAEEYADSIDRRGCAFWRGLYMGYLAASLKHKQP